MKRLIDWFRKKRPQESDSSAAMTSLLTMLTMTEAQELTCDEVLIVLAEFAELNQRGEAVAQYLPLVEKHLALCPDCMEEYQALMAALASEG